MKNHIPARPLQICSVAVAVILVLTALFSCMMRKTAAPEHFVEWERRLTIQIDNTTDPSVLSDLYASRARLRVRADNPAPHYRGALKDFTASLDLDSRRRDAREIMDWIIALSRIAALEQDVSKNKVRYEQSEQRNRTLTVTVEQLEKREKELRKSIEELQSLELQMEQRRQQLR